MVVAARAPQTPSNTSPTTSPAEVAGPGHMGARHVQHTGEIAEVVAPRRVGLAMQNRRDQPLCCAGHHLTVAVQLDLGVGPVRDRLPVAGDEGTNATLMGALRFDQVCRSVRTCVIAAVDAVHLGIDAADLAEHVPRHPMPRDHDRNVTTLCDGAFHAQPSPVLRWRRSRTARHASTTATGANTAQ